LVCPRRITTQGGLDQERERDGLAGQGLPPPEAPAASLKERERKTHAHLGPWATCADIEREGGGGGKDLFGAFFFRRELEKRRTGAHGGSKTANRGQTVSAKEGRIASKGRNWGAPDTTENSLSWDQGNNLLYSAWNRISSRVGSGGGGGYWSRPQLRSRIRLWSTVLFQPNVRRWV